MSAVGDRDTCRVWVKVGEEQPFDVEVSSSCIVNDLKRAVKRDMPIIFSAVDAVKIAIRAADGSLLSAGTRCCGTRDDSIGTSDDNPYLIDSPPTPSASIALGHVAEVQAAGSVGSGKFKAAPSTMQTAVETHEEYSQESIRSTPFYPIEESYPSDGNESGDQDIYQTDFERLCESLSRSVSYSSLRRTLAIDQVFSNEDLVRLLFTYVGYTRCLPLVLTCREIARLFIVNAGLPLRTDYSACLDNQTIASWAKAFPSCPLNKNHVLSRLVPIGGSLDMVRWALDILESERVDLRSKDAMCEAAALHGHNHIVQHLTLQRGCRWSAELTHKAAMGGHLHTLRWLRSQSGPNEKPCPWTPKVCSSAARNGFVDILRYIYHEDPSPLTCTVNMISYAASYAADVGVLHFVMAEFRPVDLMLSAGYQQACRVAAECGNLSALQLLRSQEMPFDWHPDMLRLAIRNNHLHVLQWLHEQPGFPYTHNSLSFRTAAKHNRVEILNWLKGLEPAVEWDIRTSLCAAAEEGHVEVLRWARNQTPSLQPDSATVLTAAISHRDCSLETVRWMREQNPPWKWDASAVNKACKCGNLDVLQFLRESNPPCPWSSAALSHAIKTNNLEIVKWLVTQLSCPGLAMACSTAAYSGKLNIFQYLLSVNPQLPCNLREICMTLHEDIRKNHSKSSSFRNWALNEVLLWIMENHELEYPYDSKVLRRQLKRNQYPESYCAMLSNRIWCDEDDG
mmetsp:Transcript_14493/g.21823  ORF Transcript_14493/g.21823 Transcript_14493/m.21823 type:complete len:736 (+) Transcript_14493:125-2332(+)|eukprot:CAMPEP_0185030814 /NCGR_PEP_ID=MMETSP1103-20130426/17895_1 /TAXON_ID=36769 /ORGANISM="Paraphysomonas bandaiensis, Strain Caron Lab Isolate" /LENGTH=735 /DNA_ID=CAMNT_0027566081 /DNA_START=56 /DNA_END=2263 /DNA_ORIENTATION=+